MSLPKNLRMLYKIRSMENKTCTSAKRSKGILKRNPPNSKDLKLQSVVISKLVTQWLYNTVANSHQCGHVSDLYHVLNANQL